MQDSTVLIRKYENRRLYDTSSSRYINLEDVAALVRKGADVHVVDAKTGEDLTRVILTQIIVEDAKGQPAGLPLELLRQLIIASDRAGQEFVMSYLKAAFDTFHKVQGAVETGLSDVRDAALSPLKTVRKFLEPASPQVQTTPENRELLELRQRVAELEKRVRKPSRKRPPSRRSTTLQS